MLELSFFLIPLLSCCCMYVLWPKCPLGDIYSVGLNQNHSKKLSQASAFTYPEEFDDERDSLPNPLSEYRL